jgi:sirohydrochlorin ferrochelatase
MSGTRSLSPTAPATDLLAGEQRARERRAALIVAHGSPSSPGETECAVRALAERVEEELPGWVVRGATLAAPGALEAALSALPACPPLIFPLFMSDGWFVRRKLPQRVGTCVREVGMQLRPLGAEPALHRLCLDYAREAAGGAGSAPETTAVLIAAHGSSHDPRARQAAEAAARYLEAAGAFREVRVGFIEEPPLLAEAARLDAPAICLPFFATQAGHVEIDLPKALGEAAFPGPQLAPIGSHPGVAGIVRAALLAGAAAQAVPTRTTAADEGNWRPALP